MSFEIQKIAHLARLKISDDEAKLLRPRLDDIMNMIADLEDVDTADIAPLANPLELNQRLREDRVTETDHHQEYQAIAPKVVAGLYIVPKVIE